MELNRVVVTGSLAYDHIMSMPVRFAEHIMPDKIHMLNVSFIMDEFRREFGGTCGNIAYTLSLLEVPCLMVAPIGNDFNDYMSHLDSLEFVDTSGLTLFNEAATAQGFVMSDIDDNQIWGFFQGAMKHAADISIKNYVKPDDFVIIAPNNPEAMVRYVQTCLEQGNQLLFDPAFNITRFKDEDLQFCVKNCQILIGNDYEIELMRRKLRWSDDEFFDRERVVITTLGPQGSVIREGDQEIKIPAFQVKAVNDPTGAGDAFRAGFTAGYIKNKSLEESARMGAVAAAYAVEHYGTQSFRYDLDEFERRLGAL